MVSAIDEVTSESRPSFFLVIRVVFAISPNTSTTRFAFLLYAQVCILRSRATLVIASGYLFTEYAPKMRMYVSSKHVSWSLR